jgi:hypothetical protein
MSQQEVLNNNNQLDPWSQLCCVLFRTWWREVCQGVDQCMRASSRRHHRRQISPRATVVTTVVATVADMTEVVVDDTYDEEKQSESDGDENELTFPPQVQASVLAGQRRNFYVS